MKTTSTNNRKKASWNLKKGKLAEIPDRNRRPQKNSIHTRFKQKYKATHTSYPKCCQKIYSKRIQERLQTLLEQNPGNQTPRTNCSQGGNGKQSYDRCHN
jgi:hypothetical protein